MNLNARFSCSLLRLASLNTETDDTSDGSDTEYRATRLETNNDK